MIAPDHTQSSVNGLERNPLICERGLKVLVDDVQQNQGSQGHGQGYLGQLKSLTPGLIDDVDILNGPFSAHYGDFSGLGVVHIHLKESLPEHVTLRLQVALGRSLCGLR